YRRPADRRPADRRSTQTERRRPVSNRQQIQAQAHPRGLHGLTADGVLFEAGAGEPDLPSRRGLAARRIEGTNRQRVGRLRGGRGRAHHRGHRRAGLWQIIHTAGNIGFSPVSLGAWQTYYGAYFNETFDLTNRLSVTAGGRYNLAAI